MTDHEALRRRWEENRPLYQDLCNRVESVLAKETRKRGVQCVISSRPKGISNFLKKAIRKGYGDPYEEIEDKAGARVVCTYHDSLSTLEEIIRNNFLVLTHENKSENLTYDQIGYLGIHFQVRLLIDKNSSGTDSSSLQSLECEIQLHTRAQNLWADISHELSYKPAKEPPPKIKRAIYRLVALVEIFDDEVADSRRKLLTTPGFLEAQMLEQLDQSYYQFTSRDYDKELSLKILQDLEALLSDEEKEGFGSHMEEFVSRNHDKIQRIFEDYLEDDRRNFLLYQPEVLFVFDRLEVDSFKLKETWVKTLPLNLLESLADVWGTSV